LLKCTAWSTCLVT